MNKYATRMLAAVAALTLLTSCGTESQQSAQLNYKEVKDMVVDILKTEEGQKAIQESQGKMTGMQMAQMNTLGPTGAQQINLAVKDVLSDPAYAHTLKELMVDPKFAGDFAKAINAEIKTIHKDLLKDPKYRQELIEVLRDPTFQQILLETMKSNEHRQLIISVMQESLESPLYQAEMIKLMQKALDEQLKSKSSGKAAADSGKDGEKKSKEGEEE